MISWRANEWVAGEKSEWGKAGGGGVLASIADYTGMWRG